MKVALKNIKFFESLSEETNCFTASIYFNGKRIGECRNDGRGGETNVYPIKGKKDEFNKCDDYCNSLPDVKSTCGYVFKSTFEFVVNDLLDKWLGVREEKKVLNSLKRDCRRYICFGDSGYNYGFIKWKNNTLEVLLTTDRGIDAVKKQLKKLIDRGEKILNENIPEHILNSIK